MEHSTDVPQIVTPKLYDLILADPPWKYSNPHQRGSTHQHYPSLSLDTLKTMNIPAQPNSVLFMWATNPKLANALDVMEAWGFRYCTKWAWIKTRDNKDHTKLAFGPGLWARSADEMLLIGLRGKGMSKLIVDHSIRSVFFAKRGKHSVKPAEAKRRIGKLFGANFGMMDKLELFARESDSDGLFDVWGDQIDGFPRVLEVK